MVADQVDRLKTLHEIGQALTSVYDLDLLLSTIVEAASSMLDSEETTLYLVDEKNEVLYARAQKTDTSELPRLLSLKTSDSVIVDVYRSDRTCRLAGEDVRVATGLLGTAMLAVPLSIHGDRLGALAAYNWSKPKSFSQEDEYFLSAVSAYAAIAIRNSRVMRKKEIQASTDALTKLYNRRAFNEAIYSSVDHAQRYGTPLGLMLLDLDNYKQFNDQFGHQSGDDRLIHIGNVLCHKIRDSDKAFRIGGDEFAVLAPHVDTWALSVLGERIRKAALAHLEEAPPPRVSASGYSLSIGVSVLSDGDDSADRLFYRADQALLKAKKLGGNTIFNYDLNSDKLTVEAQGASAPSSKR
jgi:diguanylate cyclase (GGDEF)-like protein